MLGTETIISSGGTSVVSVSLGRLDFTPGTSWDLKLSSGHHFPLAESNKGFVANNGVGADGNIINVILPNVRSGKTSSYHFNSRGCDIWENGIYGEEIRLPVGKDLVLDGYVKSGTLGYLIDNPGLEKIKNPKLIWENGVLIDFIPSVTVNASITEEAYGTRLICPVDSYLALNSNFTAEVGKTYNYYIKIISTSGDVYLNIGGATRLPLVHGANTGELTAVSATNFFIARNNKPVNVLLQCFYIWEKGTLPDFSPTNPFIFGFNNSGGYLQLPNSLFPQFLIGWFSSLTGNKYLKWEKGATSPINFITNTGTVTNTLLGTRMEAEAGLNVFITTTTVGVLEVGKTYHYCIEIAEQNLGNIYLAAGGNNIVVSGVGKHQGSFVATGTNQPRLNRNLSPCDVTVSYFGFAEDGIIPPLNYLEMEHLYKSIAFQNVEDKNKRKLVVYSEKVTEIKDIKKIYKCLEVLTVSSWDDANTWNDNAVWID